MTQVLRYKHRGHGFVYAVGQGLACGTRFAWSLVGPFGAPSTQVEFSSGIMKYEKSGIHQSYLVPFPYGLV